MTLLSKYFLPPDVTPEKSSDSPMNDSIMALMANASETVDPETDSIGEEDTSVNATHVRRRRGIGIRNGGLDWWYANWCGPDQGGYTRSPKPGCYHTCHQSYRYVTSDCKKCLPSQNGFDSACMEHDR